MRLGCVCQREKKTVAWCICWSVWECVKVEVCQSMCKCRRALLCVWHHLHAGHDDPLLSSEILINSKTCKCVWTHTCIHKSVFTQVITFYSLHSAPLISFFLHLSCFHADSPTLSPHKYCIITHIYFSSSSPLYPFLFCPQVLSMIFLLSLTCLIVVSTQCRLQGAPYHVNTSLCLCHFVPNIMTLTNVLCWKKPCWPCYGGVMSKCNTH